MGSREVLNIDTAAPLCSEHSALLTARLLAPMATCRHMQIQQIRLYRRSSVPHVESQKRTRAKQKKSITWSTQTLIRKYKKQKHVTTRRNHATEENSSPIQLRVWLKQNILERAACIMVSKLYGFVFHCADLAWIHTLNLESHYSLRHGRQACFAEHVRGHQLTAFRMRSLLGLLRFSLFPSVMNIFQDLFFAMLPRVLTNCYTHPRAR